MSEKSRMVRAGAVQFQHRPGDKAANFEILESFVRAAADRGVQLLVFPEMCLTGYWHLRNLPRAELERLAEPVTDGDASRRLAAIAASHDMIVGAGLIEKSGDGRLFNAYVVALPNGDIYCHRKIHAFIHEDVSSGDALTVFDTELGARCGVLTCYDNNLGENARMTALQGAEILLAPHQTGGCSSGDQHTMGVVDRAVWDRRREDPQGIERELRGPKGREWLLRWLPARAHDNGMFLVFSNGIGPDDDEVRTGNAMILDPYGRILAETGKAGDDLVVADLDLDLIANSTGRRWIKTRRPELYGALSIPTGVERDTRAVRFDRKGA